MLLYTFYNADLVDLARGKHELSTGFVDDCAFIVMADTLNKAHIILKDMMQRCRGGLEWSWYHNLPFEMSKLAVMDFPRTSQDATPPPLNILKINPDGTTSPFVITKVDTYKYLGVTFDTKLSWRTHTDRVISKVIKWTQQLWQLAKVGCQPAQPWRLCVHWPYTDRPFLHSALYYSCRVWLPPYSAL